MEALGSKICACNNLNLAEIRGLGCDRGKKNMGVTLGDNILGVAVGECAKREPSPRRHNPQVTTRYLTIDKHRCGRMANWLGKGHVLETAPSKQPFLLIRTHAFTHTPNSPHAATSTAKGKGKYISGGQMIDVVTS